MVSVAPQQYVVRKPSGDPHAARALARSYDELAQQVRAEVRRVVAVLAALDAQWRGAGAAGCERAEQELTHDAARVAGALERAAADLRHYAHRLAEAHEHHGWSLGKLVALGAMVTIGVAAVVVTVGAAAPAEAAAAAAAVEGAQTAVAAAGAASTGAAGALDAVQALLAAVRPMSPFVVPHLISAGSSMSIDAATELVTRHRLDPHSLEVSAAVGFAGSAVGGTVEAQLAARPVVVRRLAEAGTWAAVGSDAAYANTGRVDPLDSLALGLGGFVARDVRYGVDQTRLMWKLRDSPLPSSFASERDWRRFVTSLYAGLDRAGYRNAGPFVAAGGSDVDIAIVDPLLLRLPVPRGIPLESSTLDVLGLTQLRTELSQLAGRPVRFTIVVDSAGESISVPRP